MRATHFAELRQRLVDCRAAFRTAKDLHEQATAQAEQAAVDNGKASGSNAEARARSLAIALMGDASYQGSLARLRAAETEVERVQALLDAARDERRATEWQIRAKLADGLFSAGVPNEQADDGSFDDVADVELDYYAEEAARDNANPALALVSSNGNSLDEPDFPF